MGHIVRTTLYGAVGIMTLFLVDLLDLYFISLLGQAELAAAVGYAGTLLFFTTSLCIGLAIASAALVARAIGAAKEADAKRLTVHAAILSFSITTPISLILWFFVPDLLKILGATGETLEHAIGYARIIVPSMPVLGLAMSGGGVLRAVAQPRLAMASTIAGAAANAVFDPIFIFGFGLDLTGAAIASVIARFVVFGVAWGAVIRTTDMLGRPQSAHFLSDMRAFFHIAGPAMATNLATPFGNSLVIAAIAAHGADAVAGFAVIGRLQPVAFAMIFALSGAVGPIVGQNFGAGHAGRVQRTLLDSLIFSAFVVLVTAAILFLARSGIVQAFNAEGQAADLIYTFTEGLALLFVFQGALFCANAAFNNLGRPLWSSAMNWGRATLGTLPFIWVGDHLLGAPGVLWGQAIGAVFFGSLAFVLALNLARRAGQEQPMTRPSDTFFRLPVQAMTTVLGWIPNRLRTNRDDR